MQPAPLQFNVIAQGAPGLTLKGIHPLLPFYLAMTAKVHSAQQGRVDGRPCACLYHSVGPSV